MELFSPTLRGVERSLDGFSLRHEAIAANIANVSTPGYVKQEVNFEQSLIEALNESEAPSRGAGGDGEFAAFMGLGGASVTSPGSDVLLTWQPKATPSPDGPQRLDGNHLAVETEMSAMSQNAIKYNAVSAVIAKNFQLLKTIAQAR
jgi:flagellar basal-body rod protein FlgB